MPTGAQWRTDEYERQRRGAYGAKPLAGGEWALMLLNRGDNARNYRYDWSAHVISDGLSKREVDFGKHRHSYTDLWSGKTGDTAKPFEVTVPAHGAVLLRLKP